MIADAKYTSHCTPSATAPNGPQRDDLYQMAAYLSRFNIPPDDKSWCNLYPARPSTPQAEQAVRSLEFDGGRKIVFTALPHVGVGR